MFSFAIKLINFVAAADWVRKNKDTLKSLYTKVKTLAGKFSKS